jgi:hypothetical protein
MQATIEYRELTALKTRELSEHPGKEKSMVMLPGSQNSGSQT